MQLKSTINFPVSFRLFCLFLFFSSPTSAQVKYYPDVADVLELKCGICHVENGVAPFTINSFEDVMGHLKTIDKVIRIGYMPPWYAIEEKIEYSNSLRLSEDETMLIQKWISDGCIKGSLSKHLAKKKDDTKREDYPYYRDYTVFQSSTVVASNQDRYFRVSLIPVFGIHEEMDIVGIDIIPDNTNIVHHAEVYAVLSRDFDSEIYLESDYFFMKGQQTMPGSYYRFVSSWLPGQDMDLFPEGTIKKITQDELPVLLLHYSAFPLLQKDSTTVRFYLNDPAKQNSVEQCKEYTVIDSRAWNPDRVFIPAGRVVTKTLLRNLEDDDDVSIFAIRPHAHQLCVAMKVELITPLQDTILLLDLPKWDFDWQHIYRLKNYVKAPKGSTILFKATYDNSASNPENPNNPPEDVYSSFRANDEMMVCFILGKKYVTDDENQLVKYPSLNFTRH